MNLLLDLLMDTKLIHLQIGLDMLDPIPIDYYF